MNNKNTQIVLAADIGSTRTHLATVDVRELACVRSVCFNNTEFDDKFIDTVKDIASADPSIKTANISSCVKDLAIRAKTLCKREKIFDEVNIVAPRGNDILFKMYDIPQRSLQIKYDDPQALGTDRLANAAACAAIYPEKDCVIIDAGTAITVDILRAGKIFEGGAILPGLSTQLEALHVQTDKLPLVSITRYNDTVDIDPLGTSTQDCIKAGVLYGAAGAVERLVKEYISILGNGNAHVIATGGDGTVIASLIDTDIGIVPDLTLIGCGVFFNAECGTCLSRRKPMRNAECGMRNAECGMRNAEC